jgi:threonine/homoserine/homoserine lactone efflux protein
MLLAIHAVFGLVWLSFIAFAAARARSLVWNGAVVRWLEGAVGAFFVGVAGRLALAQR